MDHFPQVRLNIQNGSIYHLDIKYLAATQFENLVFWSFMYQKFSEVKYGDSADPFHPSNTTRLGGFNLY